MLSRSLPGCYSRTMKKVLIIGAGGFVGGHLKKELDRYPELNVQAPLRTELDIRDKAAVIDAASGIDVIYNLVGIISGSHKQFHDLHTKGTQHVVAAAKKHGVKKIIYISALGVEHPKSQTIPYFSTKAKAEKIIYQSGIPYTILRPSAMFGPGSGFLKSLAKLIRWSPVIFLPELGRHRIALVAVDVTAKILAESAIRDDTEGTYIVSGPEDLTLREIIKRLTQYLHKKRLFIPIPFSFPVPGLITSSQLAMLRLENIGDSGKTRETFDYKDIYFDPDGSYPLI